MTVAAVLAGIERMAQSPRPSSVTERGWYILLKDMRQFAERWLDTALACGWIVTDAYGAPPRFTDRRVDLLGVVLILKGREVESIDRDRIVIANRLGPANTFYRHAPGCSVPFDRRLAVPVWEALEC